MAKEGEKKQRSYRGYEDYLVRRRLANAAYFLTTYAVGMAIAMAYHAH